MPPIAGILLTVTTRVAAAVPQLLVTEYDIVAVPVDTPVTRPVASTAALAGVDEVHTPPLTALLNKVVAPTHTVAVPVTVPALGSRLTVTTLVAEAVPQALVTV